MFYCSICFILLLMIPHPYARHFVDYFLCQTTNSISYQPDDNIICCSPGDFVPHRCSDTTPEGVDSSKVFYTRSQGLRSHPENSKFRSLIACVRWYAICEIVMCRMRGHRPTHRMMSDAAGSRDRCGQVTSINTPEWWIAHSKWVSNISK